MTSAIATKEDVTAGIEAERTRNLLASIVESAQEAIIGCTLEGTILSWNRGAESLFGYLASEAIGQPVSMLAPAESDLIDQVGRAIAKGGVVPAFESSGLRRDGVSVDVVVSASPVLDERGRIIATAAAIRDVSEQKRAERALLRSEENYRSLLTSTQEGICGVDLQGRCTFANPAAARMLGLAVDALQGANLHTLTHHTRVDGHPHPVDECRIMQAVGKGEAIHADDEVFWRSDQTCFPVEYHSHAVRRRDGQIVGAVVTFADISERRRAEDELRRQKVVLQTEHDTTLDGILVVDEHDKVLSFNDRFVTIWGLSPEVVATKNDALLLQAVTAKLAAPTEFLEKVRFLYEHRDQTSRDEIELSDGRTFDRYTAPVRDADQVYYGRVWFFRDITARKQAEKALLQTQEQLRHDAFYDRLTGLPNRVLLMERLERATARVVRHPESTFGLLFVDLDNFKLVNDSLGHDVGDQLLCAFARRLERCLRQTDTLSRLGGDEFVILSDDLMGPGDLQHLAERIQSGLQVPFLLEAHGVVTTASIGIVESSVLRRVAPQDLLRDADMAMYRAKKGGKARYEVFTETMHEDAVQEFLLESDLRTALNNNEFAVSYQPIVSARTGELLAFEALLRWRHPSRGLLQPSQFLSVADEMGLLKAVGEWVLRSACAESKAWQAAGLKPVRIAVNVSPGQFRDPALAETVERVLHEVGVDPNMIELELSENIVLSSAHSTSEQLEKLAGIGVRLSVDDFGVVHTSVRYLAQFPITTLKIDQCFVRDISTDRAGPIVMKALIALGHGLHLTVVVEGVETADQEAFVRAAGCDEIQGFHVGPVMEPEEAKALLAAQSAELLPDRD